MQNYPISFTSTVTSTSTYTTVPLHFGGMSVPCTATPVIGGTVPEPSPKPPNNQNTNHIPTAEMCAIFGSGCCLIAAFTLQKSATIHQASMGDWSTWEGSGWGVENSSICAQNAQNRHTARCKPLSTFWCPLHDHSDSVLSRTAIAHFPETGSQDADFGQF